MRDQTTDRASITIPAPIARPGERVEVMFRRRWTPATVAECKYYVALGCWQYIATPSMAHHGYQYAEQEIRRVEGGA